MKYRKVNGKDWLNSILVILGFVTVILTTSIFFLPEHWPLWTIIIFVSALIVVSWHSDNYAYECPNCRDQFEISTSTEFISPNGFGKKYLTCPKCHQRNWMEILIKG